MRFNFNPYVIPTPAWMLAPFPIGRRNFRDADGSMDGVINVGLTYNLGGAFSHKNAFYELAGGDKVMRRKLELPHLLFEVTLAVRRGASAATVATSTHSRRHVGPRLGPSNAAGRNSKRTPSKKASATKGPAKNAGRHARKRKQSTTR